MDKIQHPTIDLLVPCYNESDNIVPFVDAVENIFREQPGYRFNIIFVNDGSTDNSLAKMLELQNREEYITIIDLTRNFGKEAALTAAIEAAKGDAAIPMDIDLQDPPHLIPQMLAKWQEGYDMVLAHRQNRDSDSFFKNFSASLFYRFHNRLAKPHIPDNVGDFRLMDRCVLDAIRQLPETNRFMKGIFSWVGFKTTAIEYARPERAAGSSKFNFVKLWNFALDGITSFSTVPLRIWTYLGFVFALFAFIYGSIILLRTIFFGVDVPGYASLLVVIVFFGGLQLIGIGILGEYLGRTYIETKRRPLYLIRKIYRNEP